MNNYHNISDQKIFNRNQKVIAALRMILIIVLFGFVIEAKAEEDEKTTFPILAVELDEAVWNIETDFFMLNMAPKYEPNTRHKKTPFDNRKYAPAYRLRELPRLTVSTNVLHDLTTSMNLGAEVKLDRKVTLQMPVTYNPWTYNREENVKFKFLLAQPELRYWTCEAFDGHFFGLHGHYGYFNAGGLPKVPFSEALNQYRYEGYLAGAGVSYGFVFPISTRWGVEANIGVGFAKIWYDKFPCQHCAKQLKSDTKTYWGVTRAGLSLVYYIF